MAKSGHGKGDEAFFLAVDTLRKLLKAKAESARRRLFLGARFVGWRRTVLPWPAVASRNVK